MSRFTGTRADLRSEGIKNLIFDLGGVLYAIDTALAFQGLYALVQKDQKPPADVDYTQFPVFREFETGAIDEVAFRQGLRETFQLNGTDAQMDAAWLSLLLGVHPGREELLRELSQEFRLFLLSNTNPMHYRVFAPQCRELFSHFEKCYFSHEMGLRKPDPEIYTAVLEAEALNPGETLFIDDSEANLLGAENLGIRTLLYENEGKFLRYWAK